MKGKYKVVYYISQLGVNPAKRYIDSLEKIQKAKVFRIFQVYQKYGLASIVPHTKKMIGSPLWEIRIKGKDNIRIIYVLRTKESVLVLHGFTKKKQKTPQKELNLALKRYKDWTKRY
jgi:phage-related protein